MIWLTWRQFRGQALIAVAGLALVAAYLVFLGLQIRQWFEVNVDCTGCSVSAARHAFEEEYFTALLLSGFLVLAVPAIIGAFWGAPLIAREIETGTHRLVWSQSVTRTRWLAVKLAVVTLAGVAVTGALSLLLTWTASPYDSLFGSRFDPLVFPTRNVVPLGYAVFAVALGTTVGLLIRRTVPAMAVTLAVFAALQILAPTAIRPHLQAPVTKTVAFTERTVVDGFQSSGPDGPVRIGGYARTLPGAWVLTGESTPLLDAAGKPVTRPQLEQCFKGDPDKDTACIATMNLHFTVTYHPAGRYWTFQWLEFAGYLVLAALLAGFAFRRIPRGLS